MILDHLNLLIIRLADTAQTACPGGGPTGDSSCDTGLPKISAGPTQLHQILQLTFGVIAGVAVLFVVIGGLRLVISEGDPQDTAKARYTIIYALVGLLIAITAEALVTFLLGKL
ncbi:MAG TPA: pilin [Patescibacteria group bacterium]|nr:pilin [Patescibacteria group bacterium]